MIGSRLGSYEITAQIGEGGMGRVYRAKDSHLGREVALKVLPEGFTQDADRSPRFEREAKLLASLNHPNIAQIYGLETSGGSPALVMELVEGPTLADRLAQGSLSIDESLSIARQIAEALEEAHEKGIVHRDLKPQNVKASIEGKVKVLDFGLAKAMEPAGVASSPGSGGVAGGGAVNLTHSPTLTSPALGTMQGVILGTAAYMSPEQARGGAVDKRADIWAFGVVLWEMLTGSKLFAADTVTDTLAGVLRAEIDLDRLPRATPPAIRRLLRRCLERDPRNRLRDIGDARIVIAEALAGAREPAEAVSAPFGRRRLATVAAGILVAAALGALVAWVAKPGQGIPAPVRTQRLTYSGTDLQPSASPDGRFVAFSSTRDGTSRIWLKQMEGGGEQALTDGPDYRPHFAPDGNSIGYLHKEATGGVDLYRTALVGGQPRRLLADVDDFDWSPDGRSVAFVRSRRETGTADVSTLGIVDLDGRKERTLLSVQGWLLTGVRWRPDGGRIAVTRGGPIGAAGGWTILLVDPASGASQDLGVAEGLGVISASAWDARGEGLYYAVSTNTVGDLTGTPGELRHWLPGKPARTLFWASGLFPFRGSGTSTCMLTVLGPGRLVYDTWEQSEALREVDLGNRAVRQLTGSLAADRQPAYSPDGRWVVFSSNRTGNLDLWLLERATGKLRQLTDDPAQDWDPGFTPDGSTDPVQLRARRRRARDLEHRDRRQRRPPGDPRRRRRREPDDDQGRRVDRLHLGQHGASGAVQGPSRRVGRDPAHPRQPHQRRGLAGRALGPLRLLERPRGRRAVRGCRIRPAGQGQDRRGDGGPGSRHHLRARTVARGRLRGGFVGVDEQGRTGIYAQKFDPDLDTTATRRKLAGFFDDVKTESFGIAADASTITLAVSRETRGLMLAEGLPK